MRNRDATQCKGKLVAGVRLDSAHTYAHIVASLSEYAVECLRELLQTGGVLRDAVYAPDAMPRDSLAFAHLRALGFVHVVDEWCRLTERGIAAAAALPPVRIVVGTAQYIPRRKRGRQVAA